MCVCVFVCVLDAPYKSSSPEPMPPFATLSAGRGLTAGSCVEITVEMGGAAVFNKPCVV